LARIDATTSLVARAICDLEKCRPTHETQNNFPVPKEILLEFPIADENDVLTASVALTQVGDHLFQVQGIPWCFFRIELCEYLDVIEVQPTTNERVFRFVRVVEPSEWRTLGPYMVATQLLNAGKEWPARLRELESRGGHWESIASQLYICLPPGLDFNLTPWFADEDQIGDYEPETNTRTGWTRAAIEFPIDLFLDRRKATSILPQ
jgi:hypothetical protein